MKQINIVELLKDCPKGMELDCTMFEGLEFDSIVDNEYLPIYCRVKNPNGGYDFYNFTKYGCWSEYPYAKCLIFPKGETTWEGFHRPFKDGEIISDGYLDAICIFKREGRIKGTVDFYCGISGSDELLIKDVKDQDEHFGEIYRYDFATEDEKEILFKAIKDNGYKWDAGNKTLEKLVPNKFDISSLIPFESKVLVRDTEAERWRPAIWGYCDSDSECDYPYKIVGGYSFSQCIPYNGNENLLGKKDSCDVFYKNWK